MAAKAGRFDGGDSVRRCRRLRQQGDGEAKMVFDTSGGGWRRREGGEAVTASAGAVTAPAAEGGRRWWIVVTCRNLVDKYQPEWSGQR
jgi:hypothetical protein